MSCRDHGHANCMFLHMHGMSPWPRHVQSACHSCSSFFLTLFQFFELLQHFVNSCLADVALYFIQFQYLPHFVGFGKVFPHRQTSCLQELAECVGCKFCDVAMFDEEQHDLVPLQTAAQQAVRADLFCDLALHEMFGVCEHGHLA